MNRLNSKEIKSALDKLPGWVSIGEKIYKAVTFDSYMAGIEFINRLADIAEKENHHPDLTVGWCKVGVSFSTHDAGGVTVKDIAMAKEVEKLI